MSPAEITQQLGLQSLTRRSWVSELLWGLFTRYTLLSANNQSSTSNPPVPPLVTAYTRVWSGSPMRSGKSTAIKSL
jgi:hypothetical protein